jgi:hypothetical protein
MTVCTNDVALGDLVEDCLPVPVADALADREALVPEVVELQDDRIALAAVCAWMLAEERDQLRGPACRRLVFAIPGVGDISGSMLRIVLAFVRRSAGFAVVVALTDGLAAPG